MMRDALVRALRLRGKLHFQGGTDATERLRELATLAKGFGARVGSHVHLLTKLHWAIRITGAVLLYSLGARSWLFVHLSIESSPPFNFDAECCSVVELAFWAREDVLFAYRWGLVALATNALAVVVAVVRGRQEGEVPVVVHTAASALLVIVGFIHAAYYKVAFAMHAQLDYALISEAAQSGFGLQDLSEYISLADLPLIAGPVIVYTLLRARRPILGATQALCLCALGGAPFLLEDPQLSIATLRKELTVNPAASVIMSLVTDWGKDPLLGGLDILPTPHDLQKLGLPPLESAASVASVPPGHEPISIVVIAMESVGRRYAFHREPEVIMPNLVALTENSLHWANHLSPANNSTNSLFSLFTGWYPSPSRAVFASQGDLRIDAFHQYLPWIRDAFLVTPGGLKSYFPRGLLTNAGMELRDRTNLGLTQHRPPPEWWAADERDGVDAFLTRLANAESPVFAVYYSYAAHSPYFDYGPAFRVMPDTSNEMHRYYNNLRLLDTQLGRIVEAIRGRPERTLLIVLGDHDEAFNQHAGNIKHSRGSFQENFETFAVLNLPGVLEPKVIRERTLHIDILPTVLATLGIPFARSQFQGIAVTAPRIERPYVFLYGNEGTLSSISAEGIKLQMSYSRGWCRVFDLIADPGETSYRECSEDPAFADPRDLVQMRHTGMFHAFQTMALRTLQARALERAPN